MIDLKLGNCLDLMPDIPDESLDAIIADIPYGTTACSWDTVIPFDLMWKELNRIAKKKAAIVLFGSQPFTSALVMSNPEMFKYVWEWEKPKSTGFMNAPYQPLKAHEDILVFSSFPASYSPAGRMNYFPQMADGNPYKSNRGVSQHTFHGDLSGYKIENDGIRYPRSVLKFNNDAGSHPTQKPIALMEYLIRTYTKEGDTVLDFTMGSGTTMVACVNTKRNGIGYEIGESYFREAQRRVQDAMANIGQASKILSPTASVSPLFA